MDAQKFLAEFGHIANAPGGVARLRELVLQLAISGRLTERIPNDVSGSVLIERNRHKQKVWVAQKQLKRQHEPKPVRNSRTPWTLPEGWEWVRLGAVTNYGDAPKIKFDDVTADTWVLELEDIEKGTSRLLIKVLARDRNFKSTKNGFPAGAVLYGKLRPYLDKVVIAESAGVCTTEISPISFFDGIQPGYLRWYLKSPYFIAYASGSTYGMNLPRLGTDAAREALFPFPPEQEQARIVAKVDELMTLCDTLESQQQSRRKLQNSLRQATLQAIAAAQSPHELQVSWARLEANFGRLFSEPEDMNAFKGLVLDLAVTGRLLPPSHGQAATGEAVVDAISVARNAWANQATGQEQREALSMLKKLRTQHAKLPADLLSEKWCWATLLQVAQAVVDCHNKTAPYVAEGIHLVRTTDIRNGEMDLSKTKKISKETYEYWARRLPPRAGDIFFTREAPMGEAAIVPEGERVCLGQRTMLIRLFDQHFNNRFLLYSIMSPSFQTRMTDAAIGMTVKHLRVGGVEDLVVPVPPKQEQDRIVESIDCLFEMCDRYKQELEKRLSLSASLAANAVGRLTGISIDEGSEPVKVPQTELISRLRLGQAPSVKEQAPLATILARHHGELATQDLWQRSTLEIDAFYAQLKTEVAHGWIEEPQVAEVREKNVEAA